MFKRTPPPDKTTTEIFSRKPSSVAPIHSSSTTDSSQENGFSRSNSSTTKLELSPSQLFMQRLREESIKNYVPPRPTNALPKKPPNIRQKNTTGRKEVTHQEILEGIRTGNFLKFNKINTQAHEYDTSYFYDASFNENELLLEALKIDLTNQKTSFTQHLLNWKTVKNGLNHYISRFIQIIELLFESTIENKRKKSLRALIYSNLQNPQFIKFANVFKSQKTKEQQYKEELLTLKLIALEEEVRQTLFDVACADPKPHRYAAALRRLQQEEPQRAAIRQEEQCLYANIALRAQEEGAELNHLLERKTFYHFEESRRKAIAKQASKERSKLFQLHRTPKSSSHRSSHAWEDEQPEKSQKTNYKNSFCSPLLKQTPSLNVKNNPILVTEHDKSNAKTVMVKTKLLSKIKAYLAWRQDKSLSVRDGRNYPNGFFTHLRHASEFGKNRALTLEEALEKVQTKDEMLSLIRIHFMSNSRLNNHSLDTYLLEAIETEEEYFHIKTTNNLAIQQNRTKLREHIIQLPAALTREQIAILHQA